MSQLQSRFVLSAVLVFAASRCSGAILMSEDFETDGNGVRYTSYEGGIHGTGPDTDFFSTGRDYFFRTDDDGTTQGAIDFASHALFSNESGAFYYAGEDTDHAGPAEGRIYLNSISIAGLVDLKVTLLAAGNNVPSATNDGNFDGDEFLDLEVSVDGLAWTYIGGFRPRPEGAGFQLVVDSNADGLADVGAPILDSTFTEYTFDVNQFGGDLRLRLRMLSNDQGERIAFDFVRISGNFVPEPATLPLVGLASLGLLRRRNVRRRRRRCQR